MYTVRLLSFSLYSQADYLPQPKKKGTVNVPLQASKMADAMFLCLLSLAEFATLSEMNKVKD